MHKNLCLIASTASSNIKLFGFELVSNFVFIDQKFWLSGSPHLTSPQNRSHDRTKLDRFCTWTNENTLLSMLTQWLSEIGYGAGWMGLTASVLGPGESHQTPDEGRSLAAFLLVTIWWKQLQEKVIPFWAGFGDILLRRRHGSRQTHSKRNIWQRLLTSSSFNGKEVKLWQEAGLGYISQVPPTSNWHLPVKHHLSSFQKVMKPGPNS